MKAHFPSDLYKLTGPIAILVLVFIVYAIYAPGRHGTFLLDDYANLLNLVQVQSFTNIDGLLRYLFSDNIGVPADRWISKLTFLINDTTWPSHPFSFKHTNILIHIINGLLIIWLVLRLMRLTKHEELTSQMVAILTGAIWLLHPFNVSTTLYVVQRMTELSTLFSLIGMLFYLKGRELLTKDEVREGYVWMTTGLVFGTTLAFLSKENGALLPLYILTIETFLLRGLKTTTKWRYWKCTFIWLPVAFVIGWHIYKLPVLLDTYTLRPFDLGERLLTQARVLTDYLTSILLPVRKGTGVFHDDYTISHGLLTPPSTLIAIIVLIGLVSAIFLCRRKLPFLSLGLAWFFVGHILESTIVPLELYFEHRNYLPMLGPLFIICYYGITVKTRLKGFIYASLCGFLVLTTIGTWQNVRIWSSQVASVAVWEQEHPTSPRVLQYVSNFFVGQGSYNESQKRLNKLATLRPTWAGPKLKLLLLSCISEKNKVGMEISALINELESVEWDSISVAVLGNLFEGMKRKPCHMLDLDHIVDMVDTLIDNPSYQRRKDAMALLFLLKARINGYLGDSYARARNLQEAFQWRTNWHVAVEESKVWASLGEYDKALEAVNRAKSSYYVKLRSIHLYFDSDELNAWESTLKQLNSLKQERVSTVEGEART